MSLQIRRARPGEARLVLTLVRELAEYEKLLHEVEASEADIDAALFGDNPRLFCEIAEWQREPVGFEARTDGCRSGATTAAERNIPAAPELSYRAA